MLAMYTFFLTAQIDELQHLIQQLAAPSHKGLALEVLIFSGSLSDEHDLRIPDAYAEYHMVPASASAHRWQERH